MEINIHLKLLFEDHIKSRKPRGFQSIEAITDDSIVEILKYFTAIIEEELFFILKEGSTKFNSELKLIKKDNITQFFNSNFVIYSPETLDFLMIGHYEGHDGEKEIAGTDIDCSGIFIRYLKDISEEFKLKILTTKTP